ncbi:MAG TPA: hypothetical protein VG370_26650, partial [Chloroflexota bacterium]|nr:hypothetical protein [Chloroflexota bacterium]
PVALLTTLSSRAPTSHKNRQSHFNFGLYNPAEGKLYLWRRQEAEAELFAGTLPFGGVGPLRDPETLAREARVPLACALLAGGAPAAHEPDPAAGRLRPGGTQGYPFVPTSGRTA